MRSLSSSLYLCVLAATTLVLLASSSSSSLIINFVNANALQFTLPTTNPICFEHESGADSNTVTLHYIVQANAEPNTNTLQITVRNPTQALSLSDELKVTHKEESLNFQTAMAGQWEICLKWNAEYSVRMEMDVEGSVDLNFRDPAIKADDYSQLTEKVLPLFEKAEYEIDYLTQRSERFEKTVSSTYFRVIFLTIVEVVLMAGAVGWQIWTLRRFFKEKKIV